MKKHMEYASLAYPQTFCADPWQTGSTDSITIKNAIHYLDSLKIYIAGIWIVQETVPEAFSACSCKTGKVFHVTTFKDEMQYLLNLGFH